MYYALKPPSTKNVGCRQLGYCHYATSVAIVSCARVSTGICALNNTVHVLSCTVGETHAGYMQSSFTTVVAGPVS